MTGETLHYLNQLCQLPVRKIIFPFEGVSHLEEIIQKIRAAGKQPWLAVAPQTSVISFKPFLPLLDGVLVMLILPGTTQSADWTLLAKVREVSLCGLTAGVDGGMTEGGLSSAMESGATYLVIGRALFSGFSSVL